jgi:two-component system cell cycle response regulator
VTTLPQSDAAPSPTILVVDDDERIQRVLVTRLRDAGFATLAVSDGEQALAACRDVDTRPDLVILDVMMPGKDGFQVCHEIKENRETRVIPVLLLTALDGEAERARGAQSGADEFLTKPFNAQELLDRVRSLLGVRQLEQLADHRATVERLVDPNRPAARVGGASVLLIEDNDAQRTLYKSWLADVGHTVQEATSLDGARGALANADYDLIVADVMLPDGDVRHLVRSLRERQDLADLPMLLVTALSETEQKVLGFDAGADDYLVKPVEELEFKARVDVQLRKRASMQRLSERLRATAWRAVTDSLTGMYGRSFFDAHLRQHLALARRYHRAISIVMMDVDHFKKVNDRLGHLAGDDAIRKVGDRLRRRLRHSDVLCRYGGEEFAIILPEITLSGAKYTAEELRELVSSEPFTVMGQTLSITISAGVASARGGSAESLVQAADRALYRAKSLGRNRVEVGSVEPWSVGDDPDV